MNIRNIRFEFEIECNGIVNWDGDDQKENFKKCYSGDKSIFSNSNINFGKANYDYDEDHNLIRYPKISSDCIRHTLFGNQQHTPTVSNNVGVLINTISSIPMFIRGYLWPKQCIKRNSSLSISDAIAEETSTYIDTHICKQTKFAMDDNDNVAKDSTTFFKKEARSTLIYKGEGSIDLDQISFISFSQYHDRQAIPNDTENYYVTNLINKLNTLNKLLQVTNNDLAVGYFTKNEDAYQIPEYGCKLSNKIIGELVTYILNRLRSLYIFKATANAKMKKVVITLIDDPLDFDSYQRYEEFSDVLNVIKNATFHDFYTQDMRCVDDIQKMIFKKR